MDRNVFGAGSGKLWRLLRYLLWRRWVLVPALILLASYLGVSCATVYVGPAEVGVAQVFFGPRSGIRPNLLKTGTHFVLTGYERVHTYPTDIQVLDLSGQHEQGHGARVTAPIRIQTSDGYQVTLDVTVLYRIADAYQVMTKIGPGKLYEDSLVIPRSDRVLRQTLGELNSEEFYQGPKRIAHVNTAFAHLKKELAEKGIELVTLLVRRIAYDQAYQVQIEQRKIQDQMVFKNQAEGAAAKEEANKRKIISAGQAAVKVEIEKGEREVAKILSDANLERRKKDADGDLLVKTAQATGTQLENRALQGGGAGALVGQRLAEVLKGIKVIVVPSSGAGGTNPLDVGSILKQFEVGR
jgi:regulator of protease activity HflC (stomatin/prohibitin superfamily)